MADKGWISLYRQIQENPLWTCNEPFDPRSAWIDLLLLANHSDGEIYINGQFKTIKRGQFHTSQLKLAERWHWKRDKVERYLLSLRKANMIDFAASKSGTSRGTTITIVKYEIFQDSTATKSTTNITSKQHQKGQQTDISSDINNNDNNEEIMMNKRADNPLPPVKVTRYPAGRYQNVFLSAEEASKLQKEFPDEASDMIEKLSEYMETSGKKYQNHYAVIAKWIREDKDKPKQAPKKNAALNYSQRQYTSDDIAAIERKKLGLT